ncbi:hypothetical protein AVEN_181836-1 [Araneus ventricosus]|uniref:Uncharacterized protein n=1 Tax=Araneus ventricosus TaxID=182803 RepID=A0A4Y2EXL2_ARAVE|nr:hypothetical protein AVEN_181836-1 [Araneus ventricosus]
MESLAYTIRGTRGTERVKSEGYWKTVCESKINKNETRLQSWVAKLSIENNRGIPALEHSQGCALTTLAKLLKCDEERISTFFFLDPRSTVHRTIRI